MLTRLKNIDTVVTCDPQDRICHNTDLWFENGEIVRIGADERTPDEDYDCTGMIVYPGLINVHHHL
jgi:cytosine/adenosine deaminase-related metal-dependent hydrolase